MRKRAVSGESRVEALNFNSGVWGAISESSSGETRITVAAGFVTIWVDAEDFSTGPGGRALGIRRAGGAGGRSFKAGCRARYEGACWIVGSTSAFASGAGWVVEA